MVDTPHSSITHFETGGNPETPINAALDDLDENGSGFLQQAVTGDKDMTAELDADGDSVWLRHKVVEFTGSPGALSKITVPNAEQHKIVWNNTDSIIRIEANAGSPSMAVADIPVGSWAHLAVDPSGNVRDTMSALDVGTLCFDDGTAAAPSMSFELDKDTGFYRPSANVVGVAAGGTARAEFTTAAFRPAADDGIALGASGQAFADLFIASGGVINFNAGNLTLTHSSGALTFGGLGTQDWQITGDTTNLILKGQTAAADAVVGIASANQDGNDAVRLNVYGLGEPGAANQENLIVGWDTADNAYEVRTAKFGGTAVARPLRLETDGNANQVYLATDGDVGIGIAPTVRFHVFDNSVSTVATKFENNGDAQVALRLDAARTGNSETIGAIQGMWAGTTIAQLVMQTGVTAGGAEDDGRVLLQTQATLGSLTTAMQWNSDQSVEIPNGNLYVGISSGDGLAHFHNGSAGSVAAHANADDVVIENSTTGGLSILVPDSATAYWVAGSPSDGEYGAAGWNYNGGNPIFRLFGPAFAERFRFTLNSTPSFIMQSGYIEIKEMTAPSAPGANAARIFVEDDGASPNRSRLMVQFPSGAAQQIAIEP